LSDQPETVLGRANNTMAASAREAGTGAMSVTYPEFIEIPELDDLNLLILNDLVSKAPVQIQG
jgi:hypothetical protein